MPLIIQKYGGTSVATVERIIAVSEKIASTASSGSQVIVVASAMSGETNRLIDLASNITDSKGLSADTLLSTGEQVAVSLLSMALEQKGLKAVPLNGWQIPLETDSSYGKARILEVGTKKLSSLL
ncbi:MAG: aspartate kinase, partial [Pseudomonadota bacterium]|nr:aspartate kinase [Pseudomonadota bacterium]